MANIGIRPTMQGRDELLGFHLFNEYEDLYSRRWEVELVDFLRPERAFSDIAALRQQILQDAEAAKKILSSIRG